jgi:hypothetical protein
MTASVPALTAKVTAPSTNAQTTPTVSFRPAPLA